jgi:hypothetical protein
MPPRTSNLSAEQRELIENTRKNEAAAQAAFPNERWVKASSLRIEQEGPDFEVPKNLDNIKIAKSRMTPSKSRKTISDNDARTLTKEIRQEPKQVTGILITTNSRADGLFLK